MAILRNLIIHTVWFLVVIPGLALSTAALALDEPERPAEEKYRESDILGPSAVHYRGIEGCNRKPSVSNPCGAYDGWGVNERISAASCPGCGFFCRRLPPRSEITAANRLGTPLNEALRIPDDAIISTIDQIENCETGEITNETVTEVAIWNPPEVLAEFKPYGISIDERSLHELASSHPAAAFLIGLRMERGGFITAAPDMHYSASSMTAGEMTAEFALATIYADTSESATPLRPLRKGEEFHYEFRSNLSDQASELIIRSWISNAHDATIKNVVETSVALEARPWRDSPVIASGGFLAPVYRVAGFRTSLH